MPLTASPGRVLIVGAARTALALRFIIQFVREGYRFVESGEA